MTFRNNPENDLKSLQFLSSTSTFEEVQSLAQQLQIKYSQPINVENAEKVCMSNNMVDKTALTILNEEDINCIIQDFKPIKTTGDGNCLFNATSLAITGNEGLAVELRLRTALELLLHHEFYGEHPMVKGIASELTDQKGERWSLYGLYNAVIFGNRYSQSNCAFQGEVEKGGYFQAALKNEVCNTCYNCRWSGIMQIMGLASVVGCNIRMIYPDKRHSLVPLLNASYKPRTDVGDILPMLTVMWTDINGWLDRSKPFQVNHFVPLLRVAGNLNTWTKVSRSRKRNLTSAAMSEAMDSDSKRKNSSFFNNDRPTGSFHTRSPPLLTLNDFLDTGKDLVSARCRKGKRIRSNSSSSALPGTSGNFKLKKENMPSSLNNTKTKSKKILDYIVKTEKSTPVVQPDMTPAVNPLYSSAANSNSSVTNQAQISQKSSCDSPNKPKASVLPKTSSLTNVSDRGHSNEAKNSLSSPSVLPLLGVDRSFYRQRGELYHKNRSRNINAKRDRDHSSGLECLVSNVKGTLRDNIDALKKANTSLNNTASRRGTIAVGEYILKEGPLTPTTDLCKVYKESSGCSSERRIMSAELYGIISKYLNVMHLYIEGQGFISEKTEADFRPLVTFLNNQLNSGLGKIINDKVNDTISDCFNNALKYMDTKRDRDTAIALMERITSVTFVADKLLKVKNKRAIQGCRDTFKSNLSTFEEIKVTSQVVRNDMTNADQRKLALRISHKRKCKEILHVATGRGRMLKCEENESLVPLLEYAFMDSDIRERGGGGVQSHPRLIDETLYRSPDSNTDMKRARELVLAMSNPGFNISLSSCYNYTQNYKKNTMQAKRHHEGKNVNARISFHTPPRVGIGRFVINTHWTSSNVNYVVDDSEANKNTTVIDSKDAKSIVPGDIAPVQKPGKTWKQRSGILPDHDWEQGRENAVTPMAHLFLESKTVIEKPILTEEILIPLENTAATVGLTRTGKAVNLIYLSYFEPETVFRCVNELLFLMIQPSLDRYFRNPETGRLKQNFTFIVDNGQSEQPSSNLVQMTLVRFCHFLNLDKVTQVSFAEYNSKRNFVERVHPQVNKALSAHGAFVSHGKYPNAVQGSEEHRENMEGMAEAVIDCLKEVKFGGRYLDVFRGLKEDEWIFNDENKIKQFLSLSEFNKEISNMSYKVKHTPLLKQLRDIWDINEKFSGKYWEDYTILNGEDNERSSWCDKYTTVVFRKDEDWIGTQQQRMHRQPLPDYLRWLSSGGELHYLPYNLRSSLPEGAWDTVSGCFLPSNILDLAFLLLPKPTATLLQSLALLAWVPENDVLTFFDEKESQLCREMNCGFVRMQWKKHKLYKQKKENLIKMCSEAKIASCGKKYELVKRLALAQGEKPPAEFQPYDGTRKLSLTITEIAKLPVCYLQSVLAWYGFPMSGTKDELVLRVTLLANKRDYLCLNRERKMFSDLIVMVQDLVLEEKKQSLLDDNLPTYTHRTFTTPTSTTISFDRPRYNAAVQTQCTGKSCVYIPNNVSTVADIVEIFKNLMKSLQTSRTRTVSMSSKLGIYDVKEKKETSVEDNILQEGAWVKVFWSAEDIQNTGWHEGWYMAVVKDVIDYSKGLANITHVVEPSELYEVNIKDLLHEGTIKLDEGNEIEQFYEVGARVKVKWSREEIGNSGWKPGWYVGEIQESEAENDLIQINFISEPNVTYTYEVTPYVAEGKMEMVKSVL